MAPNKSDASSKGLKRQQSISTFFSPKPSSQAGSSPEPNTPIPETAQSESSPKYHNAIPPATVPRRSDLPSSKKGSTPSTAPPPVKRRKLSPPSTQSLPLPPTTRNTEYLFDPQAEISAADTNELDPEYAMNKRKLHQRFVAKLGDPKHLSTPKSLMEGEGVDYADDNFEDVEESSLGYRVSTDGKPRRKTSTVHKLTPMERQVIDIKKLNSGALLVVEVGYKYRLFGHDAQIAAKELGIVCIPGKMTIDEHFEPYEEKFASASFPTHRLHVHVKRLVSAGHKVGVVRQLETAALKAAGDNRNAPFVRKLTDLYTKGTYIDEGADMEVNDTSAASRGLGSGHLLCLAEDRAKGWGTDEKVRIGIVAVQPATGDIVFDDFEDGFLRTEIETRLLHISPCEFLVLGEISKATERLIEHLSSSKTMALGDRTRIERIARPTNVAALTFLDTFYQEEACEQRPEDPRARLIDKKHELSEYAILCLSALIKHLKDYNLQHVFNLTKNFHPFSTRSHMLLNGNSLSSLEIYKNSTDQSEKGSLFWTLDQTVTRAGHRLLRDWVGRPLLDPCQLNRRLEAVQQLNDPSNCLETARLRSLLGRIRGDMEKCLIRIYYGRCNRSELLSFLQTLRMVGQEYSAQHPSSRPPFASDLLSDSIKALPLVLAKTLNFLERINFQAARDDDKEAFFREEHASSDMQNHRAGIAAVEQDLEAHRSAAANKLKLKSIEYATVAGIGFLIEVDNLKLKDVPASWTKISGTKKVSRFHTPETIQMIRERDQQREALFASCQTAFMSFLAEISTEYRSFRDCIQALSNLDCLSSLAIVATRPGYCRPHFVEKPGISVSAGRHPIVEQMLSEAYVANDIRLDSSSTRALVITGPNMGGKSSYVRQVALISIMAQIGSFVPAQEAHLGPLNAIYTRMGAFDNMLVGESTFMVELNETAEILRQAGPRSLVILDELGRGTSTHDGVAIAHAVLDHLLEETQALLLFITHYQSLSAAAPNFALNTRKNVHMRFEQEYGDSEETITFLYELEEGVAHRSYGLNVARLAQMPQDVLHLAKVKSAELEGLIQWQQEPSIELFKQLRL